MVIGSATDDRRVANRVQDIGTCIMASSDQQSP
jgi:hypothetical protein